MTYDLNYSKNKKKTKQSKFKVGDIVRVKKKLMFDKVYKFGITCRYDHERLQGKYYKIREIEENGNILLDNKPILVSNGIMVFSPEMLKLVYREKEKNS